MTDKSLGTAAIRRMLSDNPKPSPYAPTKAAIDKAEQLGEKAVAGALKNFASMPQSTMILANPPLYQLPVDANGSEILLGIRSFSIRGLISEHEIVKGEVTPAYLIFVGLFGRKPEGNGSEGNRSGEEAVLASLIERRFFRPLGLWREKDSGPSRLVRQVAEFVTSFPGMGPEIAVQHFSALRKATRGRKGLAERGLNDARHAGALLSELIAVHMENVALGGASMYANTVLKSESGLSADALAKRIHEFVAAERKQGRNAFQVSYSLLLGRHASEVESSVLERMGVIQTHHGSAGSNMVARYLATLHTGSVSDFFVSSQMTLDCARHFGAIHDLTAFIQELQSLPPAQQDEKIQAGVLSGGLPTFGHPEIAAAGRSREVQQDPRPAIYLGPLFDALDAGKIQLNDRQRERLALVQKLYQIAFVKGIVKPGRESEEPLRLTPNTDFGAWGVQEALGIQDRNRTFLTYIFRGFGWMMDAREQLLQKIIRPVIAPDPQIIPKDDGDRTIPELVGGVHHRLAADQSAFSPRS